MTSHFVGSALCDVDPEGNVALPDFLADDTDELVVARHVADACLVGYARDHLNKLAERAERRRAAEADRGVDEQAHHRRLRRTFGLSDRMRRTKDSICISAAMRHLGRIEALALFIGTGDSFEIWNPQVALQSDDELFRELAAFRLRTRRPANPRKGSPE